MCACITDRTLNGEATTSMLVTDFRNNAIDAYTLTLLKARSDTMRLSLFPSTSMRFMLIILSDLSFNRS